jgi:hypothetical protein
MKYYCLTCGKPTSYTLNLPKFCSECGVPTLGAQFKAPSPDFNNKLKEQNTILPDRNPNNFEGGDNTNFLKKNHQSPADPYPERPRVIPVDKMSMAREEQEVEEGLLYPTSKFKVTIEGGRNQPQREEYREESEVESSEDIDSEYFDTSKFKNIKPKFKIESFAKSSDSLEGLLTQGAMMSSAPERIEYSTGPAMSQEEVLAEFQREAGRSR